MDIQKLREFFGWCLATNVGILFVSTLVLVLSLPWVSEWHARMFGVSVEWVRQAYFQYLANYKIGVIMLNLAPYLALARMSRR